MLTLSTVAGPITALPAAYALDFPQVAWLAGAFAAGSALTFLLIAGMRSRTAQARDLQRSEERRVG